MRSLHNRVARLEAQRQSRPYTDKDRAEWIEFWEQRLGAISDQQLDRLEALLIVMGIESDDPKDQEGQDIRDTVHLLDDAQRNELRSIFAVMGIEEGW